MAQTKAATKTIEGVARQGEKLILDISSEACAKFGVQHGQRIQSYGCGGGYRFVVGVAPIIEGDSFVSAGTEVLWVSRVEGVTTGLTFFAKADEFHTTQ